eukprot:2309745-Amphidinium_carterae.1
MKKAQLGLKMTNRYPNMRDPLLTSNQSLSTPAVTLRLTSPLQKRKPLPLSLTQELLLFAPRCSLDCRRDRDGLSGTPSGC